MNDTSTAASMATVDAHTLEADISNLYDFVDLLSGRLRHLEHALGVTHLHLMHIILCHECRDGSHVD